MQTNNIFKIISAALLSVCMMTPSFEVLGSSTANAESSTTGTITFYDPIDIYDYPIYLNKVRDLQTNGVYSFYDNGFFLCDINNDDMPELFVTYNTEDDGIFFAGSIYNGELVTFAEMMGAGGLRTINLYDNGYISMGSVVQSIYGTSFFRYNGGADLTNVISVSQDLADKTYTKYLNDNSYTITETEYKSILNQYAEASYKAYPIPMPYIQNGITYNYYFDYYETSEYNGSATTLTIPSTVNGLPVTGIGSYLLNGTSVKTLNISANIESFYYYGLNGEALTAINVDSANPYYTSKDGVMYNKDMTKLVKFPTARDASNYTFPQSVTEVGRYAFAWCMGTRSMVIPETIDTINDFAFYLCPNLSSITIMNPQCDIYDYWNDGDGITICNTYDDTTEKGNYLGVIRGYDNSTAQKYADNFGRTFISLGSFIKYGDCNNDGYVNIADAVMLQKYLLGNGSLTNWKNADLFKDDRIDVFDMVLMRKLLIENN